MGCKLWSNELLHKIKCKICSPRKILYPIKENATKKTIAVCPIEWNWIQIWFTIIDEKRDVLKKSLPFSSLFLALPLVKKILLIFLIPFRN